MKLSEYKGSQALEVLADMINPVATILQDEEFVKDIRENYKKGSERPRLISYALRHHADEVIQILAATEQTSVDEYAQRCTVMSLPAKILDILNDKDLMSYFLSSAETETSSGSATESTVEKRK